MQLLKQTGTSLIFPVLGRATDPPSARSHVGCRVQDAGYGMQHVRMQDSGYGLQYIG